PESVEVTLDLVERLFGVPGRGLLSGLALADGALVFLERLDAALDRAKCLPELALGRPVIERSIHGEDPRADEDDSGEEPAAEPLEQRRAIEAQKLQRRRRRTIAGLRWRT